MTSARRSSNRRTSSLADPARSIDLFAESLDGRGEAADLEVAVGGQLDAGAAFPHLGHRRRHQWQGGVVPADITGDEVDQRRFDAQAGAARRFLDDPAHLVVGRRADEQLGVLGRAALNPATPVSAPYSSERTTMTTCTSRAGSPARSSRRVANPSTIGGQRGEHLFELVDDQQSGAGVVEILDGVDGSERIMAGHHDVRPPRRVTGQSSAASEGDQPGPHQRRLAAARRTDHDHEPSFEHAGGQFGDEALTSDEQLGVLWPVARQRPVRLAADPRGAAHLVPTGARRNQFDHLVEHGDLCLLGHGQCAG